MKQSFIKKEILYVIPYFAPAWSYGGTVKASFDFAMELVELGHHVTVATTDAHDSRTRNNTREEIINGVRVIRFRNVSNNLAKKLNLYAPIGFRVWLKRNLKNYDIVHIHELFTYQSIITSSLCRKMSKPYVIQPHGSLFQVARNTRFSRLKSYILDWFGAMLYSSGAVIALNEKEKDNIVKACPKIKNKVVVIPNGLNLDEFKDIAPLNLHQRFSIPTSNKIIVYLGRLKNIKGVDISLSVLSKIKNEIDFTFLVIGPDEGELANLKELTKALNLDDRVVFTGLLSGKIKLETLKGASLSLLNSRSEGLPTTLLESAAVGLPIICSRQSNLPQVEEYQAGYVTDNEEETARKVKAVLADDHLRKKLSENALRLAKSFDIKNCTRSLDGLYGTIL